MTKYQMFFMFNYASLDYYGTGYNSLNSVFGKMEDTNYVWPYKV